MEAPTGTAPAMTQPLIEGGTFLHRGAAHSSAGGGSDRAPSRVGEDVGGCGCECVRGQPGSSFPCGGGTNPRYSVSGGRGRCSLRSLRKRSCGGEPCRAEPYRWAARSTAHNRRSVRRWPSVRRCCGSALRCWRCPECAVSGARGERSPGWGSAARSAPYRLPPPAGDCPQPPRFSFAEPPGPTNSSYPVGTVLRYRCRPGYTGDRNKFPSVTCLPNSTWASDPDFCIGECPHVGVGSPEPPGFHAAGRDTPWDHC